MENKNACNFVLLKSLIDILIFLDKADESIVDPDIAVEVMEQTSSTLMNLSSEEILLLKKGLDILAEQYSGDNYKFVKGFCENFVLIHEE